VRNFQEKKTWQLILLSRPALAFLFAGVVFFGWSVWGLLGKMTETAREKELAAARVAELQERHAELSSDIERLESPAGMEESIRQKYGYAKAGEGVIIIVDDVAEAPAPAAERGFWNWLKNLFK